MDAAAEADPVQRVIEAFAEALDTWRSTGRRVVRSV